MTKGPFRGVWGQKAESLLGRCLLRALAPSFLEKYGVSLPTGVLSNLWHQLPRLKGLAPTGAEDTSPRKHVHAFPGLEVLSPFKAQDYNSGPLDRTWQVTVL